MPCFFPFLLRSRDSLLLFLRCRRRRLTADAVVFSLSDLIRFGDVTDNLLHLPLCSSKKDYCIDRLRPSVARASATSLSITRLPITTTTNPKGSEATNKNLSWTNTRRQIPFAQNRGGNKRFDHHLIRLGVGWKLAWAGRVETGPRPGRTGHLIIYLLSLFVVCPFFFHPLHSCRLVD